MRNCFVPFCDIQCKSMEKRMMFLPPKDDEIFEKWKENLPKKRPFKRNDRVCERHFHPEDVVKTWEHIINGQVFHLERGKPRLRPSAIPTLNFPNEDEILARKANRKRTSNVGTASGGAGKESIKRQRRDIDIAKENEKPAIKEELIILETVVELGDVDESHNELKRNVFTTIYDEIYEVILPSLLWGIHRDPDHGYFAFTCFDGNLMNASKVVHVDNELKMNVRIKNVLISSDQLDANTLNTDFISTILSEIDDTIICQGDDPKCKIYPEENSDLCDHCILSLNME
ncbi:THAP-type domain-containing protein [Sergentomyia squamirostris]